MWKIGDKVAFFNIDETWDYVDDWKRYIEDDVSYYEIIHIVSEGDVIVVQSHSQGRNIPVAIDEYLIHTKESLRNHLKSLLKTKEANGKYAEICNKIKQLYRKQEFKFAT